MVGNSVIDDMRQYLNEWGEERGLAEFWWEDFGDEDEALYKGYDLLEKDGFSIEDRQGNEFTWRINRIITFTTGWFILFSQF